MRGRVAQFVGFMLLVAVVAWVVSPWFDLHPTTLRTSKRAITHYSFAASLFLTHAPSDSQVVTSTRAVQWRPGCDIVARDCARLC